MRRKSHICLGNYLIDQYMLSAKKWHRRMFLFGCVQPDMNPLTYLKGSLRARWLCGHHYPNAKPFMERISQRLERRKQLHIMDYYTLGKLIHYTADAFTYAHNDTFPGSLSGHRNYEKELQYLFLSYLYQNPRADCFSHLSIIEVIRANHREYSSRNQNAPMDCLFTLQTSCCIMSQLF